MKSSGRFHALAWMAAGVFVGVAGGVVRGAPADSNAARPAPAIAPRVATVIATEWRVPESTVRLEWGRGAESVPADAPFRLVGKGTDGWFALAWKRDEADAQAKSATRANEYAQANGPAQEDAGAVRVRAGTIDTVFVAARSLSSGSRIAPGDLRPEERVRFGPPAGARRETPGLNWEVRRPLAAGDVAAWPAVVSPILITSGEEIRMDWRRGGVTVSVTGIAMNSARKGECVRARVAGRRERLVGTATAPGRAILSMGGNR